MSIAEHGAKPSGRPNTGRRGNRREEVGEIQTGDAVAPSSPCSAIDRLRLTRHSSLAMQNADLAKLIRALPVGVAHAVAFTLADAVSSPKQDRGERVLELAERFPDQGAELRALAIRVGFDPEHKARRCLPRAS